MTALILLALAIQVAAAPAPPVVVDAITLEPAPPISWTCTIAGRGGLSFAVSGSFPAVSVEAQQGASAYHLQSTIRSSHAPFNGTFAAALTSPYPYARHYSIAVGQLDGKASAYVMIFEFYPKTHDGFAVISTAGAASKQGRTAYAAGLCDAKNER